MDKGEFTFYGIIDTGASSAIGQDCGRLSFEIIRVNGKLSDEMRIMVIPINIQTALFKIIKVIEDVC